MCPKPAFISLLTLSSGEIRVCITKSIFTTTFITTVGINAFGKCITPIGVTNLTLIDVDAISFTRSKASFTSTFPFEAVCIDRSAVAALSTDITSLRNSRHFRRESRRRFIDSILTPVSFPSFSTNTTSCSGRIIAQLPFFETIDCGRGDFTQEAAFLQFSLAIMIMEMVIFIEISFERCEEWLKWSTKNCEIIKEI